MKNILFLVFLLLSDFSFCCSLIKITQNGKTIVANNEDGPFPNSMISIEPAENGKYGVIYFGNNDFNIKNTKYSGFYPQGGINEKGLMFDYFYVLPVNCSDTVKKPEYSNEFIKDIMNNCSNVHQVKDIFDKYSTCGYGLTFFTDKEGDYLIIDNGRIILGNRSTFVQTNFHPWEQSGCWRYDTANVLINKSYQFSKDFCINVANATHQESSMNGTQYTYIGDLDKGLIYLYYYHDYKNVKIFNIKDELKKGKKVIYIPDLFPYNSNGWENVNVFNHHKSIIERLTDTLVMSNPDKLNEIKDSILIISKDKRFAGCDYYFLDLFSFYLCKAGDYWFDINFNYASEIYSFTKKLYPFSWGSYHDLGYLYKEQKKYQLALDNFVICQGLNSSPFYISEIDSLKKKIPYTDSLYSKKSCGHFYTGKFDLIIENRNGKNYVYTIYPVERIESRIGEFVPPGNIVMDDASIIFSNPNDSIYYELDIYYNSEKRSYTYKRVENYINPVFKKKYCGRYALDEKSYVDISSDSSNDYLLMNMHDYEGINEFVKVYICSPTNFVFKFGRFLFLEEDNSVFNKIQLQLNDKTITFKRIL